MASAFPPLPPRRYALQEPRGLGTLRYLLKVERGIELATGTERAAWDDQFSSFAVGLGKTVVDPSGAKWAGRALKLVWLAYEAGVANPVAAFELLVAKSHSLDATYVLFCTRRIQLLAEDVNASSPATFSLSATLAPSQRDCRPLPDPDLPTLLPPAYLYEPDLVEAFGEDGLDFTTAPPPFQESELAASVLRDGTLAEMRLLMPELPWKLATLSPIFSSRTILFPHKICIDWEEDGNLDFAQLLRRIRQDLSHRLYGSPNLTAWLRSPHPEVDLYVANLEVPTSWDCAGGAMTTWSLVGLEVLLRAAVGVMEMTRWVAMLRSATTSPELLRRLPVNVNVELALGFTLELLHAAGKKESSSLASEPSFQSERSGIRDTLERHFRPSEHEHELGSSRRHSNRLPPLLHLPFSSSRIPTSENPFLAAYLTTYPKACSDPNLQRRLPPTVPPHFFYPLEPGASCVEPSAAILESIRQTTVPPRPADLPAPTAITAHPRSNLATKEQLLAVSVPSGEDLRRAAVVCLAEQLGGVAITERSFDWIRSGGGLAKGVEREEDVKTLAQETADCKRDIDRLEDPGVRSRVWKNYPMLFDAHTGARVQPSHPSTGTEGLLVLSNWGTWEGYLGGLRLGAILSPRNKSLTEQILIIVGLGNVGLTNAGDDVFKRTGTQDVYTMLFPDVYTMLFPVDFTGLKPQRTCISATQSDRIYQHFCAQMKYSIAHGSTIVLLGKDLKDDLLSRFLVEPGVVLKTASFRFEVSLSDRSKVDPEMVLHAAQLVGMAEDRWSMIFAGWAPCAWLESRGMRAKVGEDALWRLVCAVMHHPIELNGPDRYFEELKTVVNSEDGDGVLFFSHFVSKMDYIERKEGAPLSPALLQLESPFFSMLLQCYHDRHLKAIRAMAASLETGSFTSTLGQVAALIRSKMLTSKAYYKCLEERRRGIGRRLTAAEDAALDLRNMRNSIRNQRANAKPLVSKKSAKAKRRGMNQACKDAKKVIVARLRRKIEDDEELTTAECTLASSLWCETCEILFSGTGEKNTHVATRGSHQRRLRRM